MSVKGEYVYETKPAVWPIVQFVDWDGVDLRDYSYFSDWWMAVDCGDVNDCNSVDLDYSGAVDANDLGIFTNYWLFGKEILKPLSSVLQTGIEGQCWSA